jgi:hypothetical protein
MEIGDHQAEAAVQDPGYLQPPAPVLGVDHGKAGLEQHPREETAEQLLVVNQKDRGRHGR